MLQFEQIDIEKHREEVLAFRKDSFAVSFGETSGFDAEEYLYALKQKQAMFPEGFVLAEENNTFVGQLELSIREYNGKEIGYVHLYYLTPENRGMGKGQELHRYAKQFFKKNGVREFHLRVSPSNTAALTFYRKIGMEAIGPEFNGKVLRMRGFI